MLEGKGNMVLQEDLLKAIKQGTREVYHDKLSPDQAVNEVRSDVVDEVWCSYPSVEPIVITEVFNRLCKTIFRDLLFETSKRCDGRDFADLRQIQCHVDLYKPLHGSSLFQRGQTQVFCTVALNSQESAGYS
uniref:Uncharacterized protein n=1 Tax=Glossina austeni TaxID=7395 RepID=A0A1A9UCL5_GLOAU